MLFPVKPMEQKWHIPVLFPLIKKIFVFFRRLIGVRTCESKCLFSGRYEFYNSVFILNWNTQKLIIIFFVIWNHTKSCLCFFSRGEVCVVEPLHMNLTIKDHPMQDVMVVAMATLSKVCHMIRCKPVGFVFKIISK